ncbi:hypothetical protein BDZ91DRAFT_849723 [Kalaharituber pfeilii]|nr:hypothetical protein BDZ91DRAFT_849723 [Kalaharituber pfeilii]
MKPASLYTYLLRVCITGLPLIQFAISSPAPRGSTVEELSADSRWNTPNSADEIHQPRVRTPVELHPDRILPRQDAPTPTPTAITIDELVTIDKSDLPRANCGFDGDSDTYGLGIRIGIYTQWASNVIANWYVVDMGATMRVRATLFQMAMAVALMFITVRKPRPHAVDALIIIVILLGNACSLTSHTVRPRQWKHTTLGGRMRFLFFFLLSLYASWFWWSGMERFKSLPPQPSHCSGLQYGFFFHRTNLFADWYRKTNFAFAVTGSAVLGTIFVGFIQHYYMLIWTEFWAAFKDQTSGEFGGLIAGMDGGGAEPAPEAAPPQMVTGAKELAASKDRYAPEANPPWWKPALAAATMVVCIITVELLITWNNIAGVNTVLNTGQLIPLVIGIGGLLKILFRWWQMEKVKRVNASSGNVKQEMPGKQY